MEYAIIKLKKNYVMCDLDMIDTEVKAGTRVLVEVYEDGRKNCICFKELSDEELDDNIDGNECFEFMQRVITRKGTIVDIYRDMETLETFFYCRHKRRIDNV